MTEIIDKMPYDILNFTDTGGIDEIVIKESQNIPALMPALLVLIYVIILGVGFYSQERRTGAGNLAMWSSIAGLITTAGSFVLFLADNMINIEVVIICLVVTIISAFLFLVGERE